MRPTPGTTNFSFIALAKIFDRDDRATGFKRLREALTSEGLGDLAQDITGRLARIEHLVPRIKDIRNKSIAHNEARMSRERVYEAAGLKPDEIKQVIEVACDAINDVASQFSLTTIDTNPHRFQKATLAMLKVLRRGRASNDGNTDRD